MLSLKNCLLYLFSITIFSLIAIPLFGMQKAGDNDNNWDVALSVKKKGVLKKNQEQLQKEQQEKKRKALAYAKKQAWLARQEIIQKNKQKREKIDKAVLRSIEHDVVDDKENNIVTIQDYANHQKIYVLKRDQEIFVEDFKVEDRPDYLIGEAFVNNSIGNNHPIKQDWNHNFNPLVKQYLKYGEPNTIDVDGCHQYVIVGAIADNEDQYFDCGEFEYGVKDNQDGEKVCYHHCFRTHACRYLKQQDQEKLQAYYMKKRQEREQDMQNIDDESDEK